jgi:acetyl-CoA acetyltransferase
MESPERKVIVSGIGMSSIGRRLGRSAMDLTLQASMRAISDAGLSRRDIDGMSTFHFDQRMMIREGAQADDVQDALRLDLNWFSPIHDHASMLSTVVSASMAIACGLAKHVLVYRTLTESTDLGKSGGNWFPVSDADGYLQWMLPMGAMSPANWTALHMKSHFDEFGTTREQLAQISLSFRKNAGLNPDATLRTPLTIDDYLGARMISDPLCLLDCDIPVDACTAIVLSGIEYAPDTPHPAVQLNAVGTACHGRPVWDQRLDFPSMGAMKSAADQMWSRTDLVHGDVDVAELYDGFSWFVMSALEGLGFCGRGESGPFVEGGTRIALDGELPLNTSGGQLSAGRLHGLGLFHEAVVQLRRDGAARQVKDAEVAVVTHHGGPFATAILLNRWS